MRNLLFFLWLMFFPLVDDIATWVVYQTKGEKMKEPDGIAGLLWFIAYAIVAYLLYESA